MTRLNNSAYPEHPWRSARTVAPRENDETNEPSRATIRDLAYQQDIPALKQHLNNTEQT